MPPKTLCDVDMKEHSEWKEDFSRAVLDAFRKRSKSISRRGASLEYTPVKEITNGRESDRSRTDVTIAYRVDGAPVKLRVRAWGDRWVWVDARRVSKSGWVWEFTSEGRLLPSSAARDLVSRTEETMDASFLPVSDVSRTISAIWSKCLATGPRRV